MVLETIWFLLWGLLWALFFMTDGFDFGAGILYPFLGKNDKEKTTIITAIGPLWDGNEVWLITAGGVTFAAFPMVYAVMFSSLYSALMLILFALILRGVSFEFRNQLDSPAWKKLFDMFIFIGSFLPALLFGVAFANIFQGIPFDGNGVYHGNLFTLLNPYGLLGGVLFMFLFLSHGAIWLSIRTTGDLFKRSERTANYLWPFVVVAAVIFLIASAFMTDLYTNYLNNPILFIIIIAAVMGLLGIKFFLMRKEFFKAWFASSLAIVSATFFGVVGMFPNLYPSSLDKAFSLSAFNASSSPLTLKIMLGVVIVFVPLVIGYQAWTYNLFKGKVTDDDLNHGDAY